MNVFLKIMKNIIKFRKGIVLTFPIFLFALEMAAQDVPHLPQRTDSLIRSHLTPHQDSIYSVRKEKLRQEHIKLEKRYRDRAQRVDTSYIQRPNERLTLRVIDNVSVAGITARMAYRDDIEGDMRGKMETEGEWRNTITFGANYLGIGVALAINPAKIFGKHTSTEFNINKYGNNFGFDVVYMKNNSYSGKMKFGEERYNIERRTFSNETMTLDGYYVFNGKKFSFPAAFSQTYKQIKSAGSLMLGASFNRSKLINDSYDPDAGYILRKINVNQFAVGVGYGYNWVPTRRWLIHCSAMPFFGVFRHNRVYLHDEKVKMPYRFPEMQVVGRVAAIYNVKKYFWGMTGVFNFQSSGDRDVFLLKNYKSRIRLIFGFRL